VLVAFYSTFWSDLNMVGPVQLTVVKAPLLWNTAIKKVTETHIFNCTAMLSTFF